MTRESAFLSLSIGIKIVSSSYFSSFLIKRIQVSEKKGDQYQS